MNQTKVNYRSFLSTILMLCLTSNIFGKNLCTQYSQIKTDSIWGYLNDDVNIDLIIIESDENCPPNIKLQLFFNLGEGKFELQKDKNFVADGAIKTPSFWIDNDHKIHVLYNYYKNKKEYIYKYFESYNDWFLYYSISDDINDLCFQNVFRYWPLFETAAFGTEEGWISIVDDQVKDSTLRNFEKQYLFFLNEYKSNSFNQINTFEINDFNTILSFVGINNDNVQKINDLGFFLCEAGRYKEAIYVLKNVANQFPERTVVYINLGDAFLMNGENECARQAYQKYIELMKASGKQAKIPQRVFKRLKDQ